MALSFYAKLFHFLKQNDIKYSFENQIIRLKDVNYSFYLVLDDNRNSAEKFELLRREEQEKHQSFLVFIWFDLWTLKSDIVLSKLKHLFGLSQKIHARKTKVKQVNKIDSTEFYNANHLNSPLLGFKRLGLYLDDKLIALASFAKKRKFRDGSYSAELLQFSTQNGIHINGGLSKLVKHFCRQYEVDSLMTYIDLDWSNGKRFKTIGFETTEIKPLLHFKLNSDNRMREISTVETPIFNMGSIKSILTIN